MFKKSILVCIPVHGDHHRLARSLESLVPFKNYLEILVVDDTGDITKNNRASREEEKFLIKEYLDSAQKILKFNLLRNEYNIGLGASRNRMIKSCENEFITFLDCGDTLQKSFFDFYINQSKKNKNIDIINYRLARYFPKSHTYQGQASFDSYNFESRNSIISEMLALRIANQATARIYSTKFLRENNILFIDKNIAHEDLGFTYKAFLHAKQIINSPDKFSYIYYIDPEPSISRQTFSKKYLYDIIFIWQDRINYLRKLNLLSYFKQDLIDGIVSFIFWKIKNFSNRGRLRKLIDYIYCYRTIKFFVNASLDILLNYDLLSAKAKKRIGLKNIFILYKINLISKFLNLYNIRKNNIIKKNARNKTNTIKYLVIGNGPSSKHLLDYELDYLFAELRKNNFKVIVMNKFLRLLKNNQSHFPDYYVAGDSFINIQIYDLFFKYHMKFLKLFISWPSDITKKYIYKKKDIYNPSKSWKTESSILNITENKMHLLRNIKNDLFKLSNVCKIGHFNTGLYSLNLPYKIENRFRFFKYKNIDIYCIGLDENYKKIHNKKITKVSSKNNTDYLSKDYLSNNDYVSPVLNNRKDAINNVILSNELVKNVKYINLSSVTQLNFMHNMTINHFNNKFLK